MAGGQQRALRPGVGRDAEQRDGAHDAAAYVVVVVCKGRMDTRVCEILKGRRLVDS